MVEILSLIELIYIESLLGAVPDVSTKSHPPRHDFLLSPYPPALPKGTEWGRKSSVQCRILVSFCSQCKVSNVTSASGPEHGGTASDRHICEGQMDRGGAPCCHSIRRGRLGTECAFLAFGGGSRVEVIMSCRKMEVQKWTPSWFYSLL